MAVEYLTEQRNPYEGRPGRAFWRTGVASCVRTEPPDLYRPKWPITRSTRITTAGSCFAQHITRTLRDVGCHVIDAEPPPQQLPADQRAAFGYGMYSARYGNIYNARQLRQLVEEAYNARPVSTLSWERNGAFHDGLRPGVEPEGLGSPDEVYAHRVAHLDAVRHVFWAADVVVFTLGLTEAWIDVASGSVLPVAPGVVAGRFDPAATAFHNFGYEEIKADLLAFMARVRQCSSVATPRFLLTVSPVPLTATATDGHVLTATMHAKAVLRAVAGDVSATDPDVDYFPSFELICNPWLGRDYFAANRRSVTAAGVDAAMRTFLSAHGLGGDRAMTDAPVAPAPERSADDTPMRVVCEEQLLDIMERA